MKINHDREIRALSRTLNLSDEAQDWGIVNSGASRVSEFIRFCESAELIPAQQWAMAELVLASANDALEAGGADDLEGELARFLARDLHGLNFQVRYWSSLQSEEEFPIAHLLRQLLAHA